MPKVSIIVPVYNTENYLDKCLHSLVNQTMQDIEILIVNDGSTDNSKKIINTFAQNYSQKIKVLEKSNGGLGDARNFAIPYVSGEYIGFVDSDDYVEPNMYEELYNNAMSQNADIAECDFYWEYPNKLIKDYGYTYAKRQDLFLFGRVMVCNKLFKTEIIKNNNIFFPVNLKYEDIEFFYKYIAFVKKIVVVNLPFYHYLQRSNSIVNCQTKKVEDIFIILNNILAFYKLNNLYEEYSTEIEYLYVRILLGSSFLRTVQLNDKLIRKELLDKTISNLYLQFPNWKKNKLLKIHTKKNIYYKSVNKFTFKIYSFIFRWIKKGAKI